MSLAIDATKQKNDDTSRKCLELEAETLSRTVILSGNAIPEYIEGERTIDVARTVARDIARYEINPLEIVSVHRAGRSSTSGDATRAKIALKFKQNETKRDFIQAVVGKKDDNLFVNELLTPGVYGCLGRLRKIKKDLSERVPMKLHTVDGKIRVKHGNMAKYKTILTENECEQYVRSLGITPADNTSD